MSMITTWNPASAIILMLVGMLFTVLSKIVFAWLDGGNKTTGAHYMDHEDHAKEITKLRTEVDGMADSLKDINDFKISLAKSEMYLKNISEKMEKLDTHLEKNLDEIFTRLRKLEAKQKVES